MDLSEIGYNIKKRRKEELGLTLDELAERMGMRNKRTLSVWENCDVNGQYPKLNHIMKLSEALDCDPEYLLGFSKTPQITTSWIAEKIPLSREAIELLMDMKKDCDTEVIANYEPKCNIIKAGMISAIICAIVNDEIIDSTNNVNWDIYKLISYLGNSLHFDNYGIDSELICRHSFSPALGNVAIRYISNELERIYGGVEK